MLRRARLIGAKINIPKMSSLELPIAKRPRLDSPTTENEAPTTATATATDAAVTDVSKPVKLVIGVQEKDVGIKKFCGSHDGFSGLLKQRFSDFMVHEITPAGKVVQVEHVPVQAPEKKRETLEERKAKQQKKLEEINAVLAEIPDTDLATVDELLKEAGIAEKILNVTRSDDTIESALAFEDKEARAEVHGLVRRVFKEMVESQTTAEYKFVFRKSIKTTASARSNTNRFFKLKHGAPELHDKVVANRVGTRDNWTHFTLYKENKDSFDCHWWMSKFLHISTKSLTMSGTKDKRAVTVQRMSVYRVPVERLVPLNKVLRKMVLADFKYEPDRLWFGTLSGNQFHIVLRDVQAGQTQDESVIQKSLESLRDNGFINYYGMQRFGTQSMSTHMIGKLILKGDYAAAIKSILGPQEVLASENSRPARELFASQPLDPAAALEVMPNNCATERALLTSLVANPFDHLGAISKIPRALRLMYVHAYQSFIWNSVVTERLDKYGMSVFPGDLVIVNTDSKDSNNETKRENEEEDQDSEFEEDVAESEKKVRVRPISESEVDQFSIYDVVVPTPGHRVRYPSHMVESYERLMAPDGLDPHNMMRNVTVFSLAGSYRKIMAKPADMQWWVRKYDNPWQPILRTDLELLAPASAENPQPGSPNNDDDDDKAAHANESNAGNGLPRVYDQDEIKPGDRTAVVIKFKLGTSQYATMALREGLKIETSRRGPAQSIKFADNYDEAVAKDEKRYEELGYSFAE
ncbi:pseudouridine synthase [Lipomyces japonicus]|uniref:pseudouridine synthase n=1 Tax=Lipomyces japonicus TaxID=56871 RepID=UPI0034CE734F